MEFLKFVWVCLQAMFLMLIFAVAAMFSQIILMFWGIFLIVGAVGYGIRQTLKNR